MDTPLPTSPSPPTRGPGVATRLSVGVSKKKAEVVEPPITTRASRRRPTAKKAPAKPPPKKASPPKKAPAKPPARRAPSEKTLGKRPEVPVGYSDDDSMDDDEEVPSPGTQDAAAILTNMRKEIGPSLAS